MDLNAGPRFANFDAGAFLRDHWQKQPLLIRNPWDTWTNPLDPDELAGLACEDAVESRLITRAQTRLELEEGPLPEERFDQLGKAPWTLLVEAVDHHVPAVAALLEAFRFIPNWRIDDVMVSVAADGGGVGPHFDQYDVFLIQGLGRRRWQLGAICNAATALLPHDGLRLLADFVPTAEWVLEPGDMLYVPPLFAHNGVALGDNCMTYSIGLRAPSRSELIAGWGEHQLDRLDDHDRYVDPDLAVPANPGEISAAALDRLHAMVTEQLADRRAFARWFGGFTSAPKYPEIDWSSDDPVTAQDVREMIAARAVMARNPAHRFAFWRDGEDALVLCVDGECFECEGALAGFAERLCAHDRLALGGEDHALDLLVTLLNRGSLARVS